MNAAAIVKLPLKLVELPVGWAAKKLSAWSDAPSIPLSSEIPFIPVTRPVNFNELPQQFATGFIAAKKIPARRLFRIKNAFVGGQATVFRSLRIFLPSLPWLQAVEEHRNPKLLLKQWRPKNQVLPNEVALVYDQWSAENYYHWMIESLPRLELLLRKYPDSPVLVPQPTSPFINRTLDLMGVKNQVLLPKQLLHAAETKTLLFPELVYYDDVAVTENEPATEAVEEPIQAVRQKLLQGRKTIKQPFRKVYVSRKQQKTRCLLNENEVVGLVQQYDFEVVYFEELSFDRQVALMQETEILVGVHGANMVNLMFLPEGAKVVELMNEHYVNDAYYLLASTLRMHYFVVPCSMELKQRETALTPTEKNDASIRVSLPLLQRTLLAAINLEKQQVNIH